MNHTQFWTKCVFQNTTLNIDNNTDSKGDTVETSCPEQLVEEERGETESRVGGEVVHTSSLSVVRSQVKETVVEERLQLVRPEPVVPLLYPSPLPDTLLLLLSSS